VSEAPLSVDTNSVPAGGSGGTPGGKNAAPLAPDANRRPKSPAGDSPDSDGLTESYPQWSKGFNIPYHGQVGEWRPERGPPYAAQVTLYADKTVEELRSGEIIRKTLGLHTAMGKKCDLHDCSHAWVGNRFLGSFDGSQFRFLYRNTDSVLVIPSFRAAAPILGARGLYRLHHYLRDGRNTVVVTGGVGNLWFINGNIATLDGGFNLEPNSVDGPFEAQPAVVNSPFESLAATFPGPGAVVGARLSSLPSNAISYYEAEDTSVLFEIPLGTGRIVYLGYGFPVRLNVRRAQL